MRRTLLLLVFAFGAASGGGALAQSTGPLIDVQREPPPLPGLPEKKPETAPLTAPAQPAPPAVAPDGVRIMVNAVRIEGATVIPLANLQQDAAGLIGHRASLADIEAVRQAMTRRYIDAGYINSGVLIPAQDGRDGVILFQVVEGRLTTVRAVDAPGRSDIGPKAGPFGELNPAYIERRLAGDPDEPLNIHDLQDRFAILLDDPNIARLRGDLQPGAKPGEAELTVEAETPPPFSARATFSNDHTVSTGPLGADFRFDLRNLTGWGDALRLDLSATSGRQQGLARFAIPVTVSDITPFVEAEYSKSHVVEQPFDTLDIENRFVRAAVGVDAPFYRTPNQRLSLGLAFEVKQSDTTLLGMPLPPVGLDDETVNVTVLRFSQEFVDKRTDQILALRSSFGIGLPVLGASDGTGGDTPDAAFLTWLGQGQFVRRLNDVARVVVSGQVQLASGPLFATEQLGVGGHGTVRGYRKNASVDDNAAFGTVELPITLQPIKLIPSLPPGLRGPIEVAPFFDAGVTWSAGGATNRTVLAGIGAAVRWQPNDYVSLALTYANPLRNLNRPLGESDLTDEAIYFSVTLRYN